MNKLLMLSAVLSLCWCSTAVAQSIEINNYLGMGMAITQNRKPVYVPSELVITHQARISGHTGITYITPKKYIFKLGFGSTDLAFRLVAKNLLTELVPRYNIIGEYSSASSASLGFGRALAPNYTYLTFGKRISHKKMNIDLSTGVANIYMREYYDDGRMYVQSRLSDYDSFVIYSPISTDYVGRSFGLASEVKIERLIGKKQRSAIGLHLLGVKGFSVISSNVFNCILNDIPYKFTLNTKGSVMAMHVAYTVRLWQKKAE